MELYELLICDDEWMIREQIARSARELGGFSIETADSGLAALEILERKHVDGLVLDVRMPKMDGITLLKELNQREIRPVVVILSGHDEFEYAQQCLRYGAVEYLLKPLTEDQIQSFLLELRQRILRKGQYLEKLEEYGQKLDLVKPVLREQFFRELLQRSMSRESVGRMEEFLDVHILYPYLAAAVIHIRTAGDLPLEDDRNSLRRYALGELLEAQLKERFPTNLFHTESQILTVVAGDTRENLGPRLQHALSELLPVISRDLSVQFHAGIGSVVTSVEKIRDSYAQALYALSVNDFDQETGLVDIKDIVDEGKRESSVRELRSTLRELMASAAVTASQELVEHLRRALEQVRQSEADLDTAIYFCSYLAVIALDRLDIQLELLRGNPLYEIAAKTTPEEVYHSAGQLLETMEKTLNASQQNRIRRIADNCRKIIERDYGKKIGIMEIAEQMEVSSNYLSTIFRRETQYSVNEYLNAVRLKHAKRLLRETNLKVYEIAEQVGFSDTYYFSSVFKKLVGVTPSEYRNSV